MSHSASSVGANAADVEGDAEGVLRRAAERQARAQRVLDALDLVRRWSRYGRPVVVGSVAYGLVVEPDIDLEIYCVQPRVEDGFAVVSHLALVPGVWKVRFSNELQGPDPGLYWQVRYRDPAASAEQAQEVWTIDMWLLADDYAGPRSADLVEPMRRALTPETRAAILQIKEAFLGREAMHGIDIYRAVLDGGVRTPEAYERWIAGQGPPGLTSWRPSID
jgi:hypothetical protein